MKPLWRNRCLLLNVTHTRELDLTDEQRRILQALDYLTLKLPSPNDGDDVIIQATTQPNAI